MSPNTTKITGGERKMKTRGRPQDLNSKEKILSSTIRSIVEVGYFETNIEAIARSANVGKNTIYRWWGSKPYLVLEVIASYLKLDEPIPDTGSLTGDLEEFLGGFLKRIPEKVFTALAPCLT